MGRKAWGIFAFLLVLIVLFALLVNSWYSSYTALFEGRPLSEVTIRGDPPVRVQSYLTGYPLEDINATLYHAYNRVTVVLGSGDTKDYCDRTGKCQFRTRAAVEVACLIGKVLGASYYETAREMGYSDSEARKFALEQVSSRVSSGNWLSFSLKLEIGRGKIGNEKHLLIILRGPLDGATENRIYAPRRGVLVLEALDDRTLYHEALILEAVTGVSCSKRLREWRITTPPLPPR